MKRALFAAALGLATLFTVTGCKQVAAPLPTNAVNAVDAGINENLQAAHAAVVKYQADVAAGLHTPTPSEKLIVNDLINTLNVADPMYQNYHAVLKLNPAAGEPAELIAAVNAVTSNLSNLIALVKGLK